ncbi:MAG TPA: hypothetical protein VFO58_15085 [Vicinamibacterales bacterium]|nr:hypothetical protein [Vicinamibacterales bacterium]
MTAAATPVSRYLAPLLLGVSAALAAGNWYVQPDRARSWAAALLFLACLAVVSWFTLRRWSSAAASRDMAGYIRNGVVFGALMMAVPLSVKLAHALGAIDDAELSQRLTMVILGAFFVSTGNAIPKMLTPLSVMRCDGARMQAVQRFTGWSWVLTGLAYAIAWLALPVDLAEPVSVATLLGGTVVVAMQMVRVHRRRREA